MLTLRVTLQSGETHDVDVAPETVVTFKTTTLDGRLRENHAVYGWSGIADIEAITSAAVDTSTPPAPTPDASAPPEADTNPPVPSGEPGPSGDSSSSTGSTPPESLPSTSGAQTETPSMETPDTNPPVATDGSSEPSTPSPSDSTDTNTTPASTDPMTDADTAAHDAAVSSAASAIDLAPIVAPEAVPTLIAEAKDDLATALANWPDSPELADAKAKLDTLAAEIDGGTAA